jgi:thioesterase domain-containing protein
MMKSFESTYALRRKYIPAVYSGDLVVFFSTIARTRTISTLDAWKPYVSGNIVCRPVASRHEDMVKPGSLAEIGPVFAAELKRAVLTRRAGA